MPLNKETKPNNFQMIGKGIRGVGNKRTSKDHPDYSIIKIGKNTEESPGDSRNFAVTKIIMRNHQPTLLSKDDHT